MDAVNLFGYDVVAGGTEGLCGLVHEVVEDEAGRAYLVALNAEKVAVAKKRFELDQAIRNGIAYADGMSVAWAARILLGVKLERVTGTDLMNRLCGMAAERRWGVYLLGAREAINERCRDALERAYPDLSVVGSRNGYFDEAHSSAVAQEIRESGAQILFVALGSPKQELWIADNMEACGVSFAMGVGGSFDVIAGETPRAPEAMQHAGLEWAYRVAREPWRVRRIAPRFASFLVGFGREVWERIGRSRGIEDGDGR